jgi:phosphinothricin acetyltransferase
MSTVEYAMRVATSDDAEAITAIYGPIVTSTAISFELEAPSVVEMRARIERTLPWLPWLVSLDKLGLINGYVYASKHRERAAYQWSVDTAAYVREDCRGRGIGQRLYQTLFNELLTLGYFQAFAVITLPNPASIALHEALGFRHLGVHRDAGYKLGRWHDVGWWQKTLQQPVAEPPLPKPFRA